MAHHRKQSSSREFSSVTPGVILIFSLFATILMYHTGEKCQSITIERANKRKALIKGQWQIFLSTSYHLKALPGFPFAK
jgi:hypothetical protein